MAIMARIPPKSVNKNDKENLKNLERDLKNFVFGQDRAIEELSSAIKLARAGLTRGWQAYWILFIFRTNWSWEDRSGETIKQYSWHQTFKI